MLVTAAASPWPTSERLDPESAALDLEVMAPSGKLPLVRSALAAFLDSTGIGRADLRPARWEGEEGPVLRFGVAARDEALLWLLDRACDWPNGAMEARPTPVTGATVTLTGIDDGSWSVEWWDTLAGTRVANGEVTAAGGTLRLEVPTFQIDVAARLQKR